MTDFAGSFEHSADSKGRVVIPAAYRDGLGENFTVTINASATAIMLYPHERWEREKNRFAQVSTTDRKGWAYKRLFIGNAFTDNSLDAQGRVLLPAKLRTRIGATKDLVFVGMIDVIEVWDAEKYNEVEALTFEEIEECEQHMEARYPEVSGAQ